MTHDNLKELRRLLAQKRAAEDAQRFGPPQDLANTDLNNEPGFEKPSYDEPRKDTSDQFAPLYSDDDAARGLKRHLAGEYTVEDMLEVAAESGHPEAVREALDEYTDQVAKQFLQTNPDYLPTDPNLEKIIQELRHQAGLGMADFDNTEIDDEIFTLAKAGVWTVEHLTNAKIKLLRMGALNVPAGQPREINAAEILHCQRVAVSNPAGAVCVYLAYASGQNVAAMTDQQVEKHAVSLMHDPKWREISNNAALFAFANCPQTGYAPTPEREAYIRQYCGDRIFSFPLLTQAWNDCKKAEVRGQRRRTQPVSVETLDENLSDSQVSDLMTATQRERAKRLRAASGGQTYADPESQLLALRDDFERNS